MFKMAKDSLFLETLSLTSVDEGCIATVVACITQRSVRKIEPILLSFYNNNYLSVITIRLFSFFQDTKPVNLRGRSIVPP